MHETDRATMLELLAKQRAAFEAARPEPLAVRHDRLERLARLLIDNQDASAEEFESHELNREKVIPGKSKATIYVGPLKPGHYPFFGEFNDKTARGALIAE